MPQRNWSRGCLLALLLSVATAGWAVAPGGVVPVAESRNVADYDLGYRDGYNNLRKRYQDHRRPDYAEGYRVGQERRQGAGSTSASDDYVRGYGDGLNGKEARERDRDYRDGYRAGRARHQANAARDDGRDYSRGYRDGYNRYRERAAVPSRNRAYAAGFRAGQANHTALVAGSGGRPVPPIGALPVSRPQDLAGRPARALEPAMQALGYQRWSSGSTQSGDVVSVWRGPNSPSECVRVWVSRNLVRQILDANEDECRAARSP